MGAKEELLVLKFLKERGFSDAYGALRRELASQSVLPDDTAPLALVHTLEGGSSRDLVLSLAADGDVKAYGQEFGRLAAWVDAGTLDVYRPELQRVLYPVFIHCYLDLVERGATNQAVELLRTHRQQLVDMAGKGAQHRAQELQELQGVSVPQHLQVSSFAVSARSSRQVLRLSTFAFELLMRFLQAAKLWLLLGVVNDRLQFQVYEGSPQFLDAAADEQGAFAGGLQTGSGATASQQQQAMRLGLLRGNLEDLYAATVLAADEPKGPASAAAAGGDKDAAGKEGGNEGEAAGKEGEAAGGAAPLTKRAKLAKEKAAAAAKGRRKEVEDGRIDPEIPLVPFSDAVKEAAFADFAARVDASPQELPSCCFFTFVNTRQSLCSMAFSDDAEHVAGGFSDASIRIYNMRELAKQRVVQRGRASKRQSKRNREGREGQQQTYGVEDEPSEMQEALEDGATASAVLTLRGHSASVYALDHSLDQRFLFSGSGDGTLRLWSMQLREGLVVYRGHVTPVWDVAASPVGHYFASAGSDRTARLWSTEHVHALRMFVGHQADVDVVRWHPNGHYIASGSTDRTVRLWDVRSAACTSVLSGQASGVTSLAFHPDGRTLACGTDDGGIAVYDLGSGRRMALLAGHEGPVWSLGYSHGNGMLLASGGADATVRLWSAPKHAASLLAIVDEQKAAGAGKGAGAVGASGSAARAAGEQAPPHQLLRTYRTRATPVIAAAFTRRNLLLAGGALALRPPPAR